MKLQIAVIKYIDFNINQWYVFICWKLHAFLSRIINFIDNYVNYLSNARYLIIEFNVIIYETYQMQKICKHTNTDTISYHNSHTWFQEKSIFYRTHDVDSNISSKSSNIRRDILTSKIVFSHLKVAFVCRFVEWV